MIEPSHIWSTAAAKINPAPSVSVDDYFAKVIGSPDPWQLQVLNDKALRIGIMASRQAGKSRTVGAKVMYHAENTRRAMVVIGSPTQRQSAELLAKAIEAYDLNHGGNDELSFSHYQADKRSKSFSQTGGILDYLTELSDPSKPVDVEMEQQSRLEVRLTNRSRIVAVPGRSGATVRSFSAVTLLVIDEAAFAQVEFFQAVFPMLAVSHGQIILLSTPYAKFGPFYQIMEETSDWDDAKPSSAQEESWRKYVVPWTECPRITPEFIEAERKRYGNDYVKREYECQFQDAVGAVFRAEDVEAMEQSTTESWSLF